MSLTRQQQREVGALLTTTARIRDVGDSTLSATVHLSADMIDALTAQGGAVFRDYTAKERRRMASEGTAMPDGSFPIATCADASNAIHAVGRAKDRSAVESHIRKRVRALKCSGSIFENWK